MFDTENYTDKITKLKEPIDIELKSDNKWYKLSQVALAVSGISVISLFIYHGVQSGFNYIPNWVYLLVGISWISAVISNKYADSVEILTLKKERLEKALEDIKEINLLWAMEKEYVFYLRDFNTGRLEKQEPIHGASLSGIANPVNWPTQYGKKTTTLSLNYFSKNYPVILLNSDLERTKLKRGLYIYPDDSHWFEDFKKIGAFSTFTAIDYDYKRITQNISIEIDSLILIGKKNLIFIGTKEDRISADQRFPKLAELIVCNCYVETMSEGLNKTTEINFKEFEAMCCGWSPSTGL